MQHFLESLKTIYFQTILAILIASMIYLPSTIYAGQFSKISSYSEKECKSNKSSSSLKARDFSKYCDKKGSISENEKFDEKAFINRIDKTFSIIEDLLNDPILQNGIKMMIKIVYESIENKITIKEFQEKLYSEFHSLTKELHCSNCKSTILFERMLINSEKMQNKLINQEQFIKSDMRNLHTKFEKESFDFIKELNIVHNNSRNLFEFIENISEINRKNSLIIITDLISSNLNISKKLLHNKKYRDLIIKKYYKIDNLIKEYFLSDYYKILYKEINFNNNSLNIYFNNKNNKEKIQLGCLFALITLIPSMISLHKLGKYAGWYCCSRDAGSKCYISAILSLFGVASRYYFYLATNCSSCVTPELVLCCKVISFHYVEIGFIVAIISLGYISSTC